VHFWMGRCPRTQKPMRWPLKAHVLCFIHLCSLVCTLCWLELVSLCFLQERNTHSRNLYECRWSRKITDVSFHWLVAIFVWYDETGDWRISVHWRLEESMVSFIKHALILVCYGNFWIFFLHIDTEYWIFHYW
jgi:hypothetical protein